MEKEETPITSGIIKRIDKSTVHRICSGQVVVDLATAVKELVENALDAKATHVEVKLKEFGAELIEVSDNGIGIKPEDYEGITMKYATSKLKNFSDLSKVDSFGFRGEAVSSLCELSGIFSILTKTDAQPVGCKIIYDRTGTVLSKIPAPRPVGTTITVTSLFEPLPVRRGEFLRNIKKQYDKLLRVLQAYALISTSARISVSNIRTKGGIQSVLATQASSNLRDNITNIFGSKFNQSLAEFTIIKKDPKLMDCSDKPCETLVPEATEEEKWKIHGLVSRAGEGVGRSDNDRQFFFLNGRPVDLPKFTRAVNEVWRQYEMKQKPACVINVELPNGCFDLNVTPDKRQIIIENENLILEEFKEKLHEVFQPSRNTFLLNQASLDAFVKPSALSQTASSSQQNQVSVKTFSDSKILLILQKAVNGSGTKNSVPLGIEDTYICALPGNQLTVSDSQVSGGSATDTTDKSVGVNLSAAVFTKNSNGNGETNHVDSESFCCTKTPSVSGQAVQLAESLATLQGICQEMDTNEATSASDRPEQAMNTNTPVNIESTEHGVGAGPVVDQSPVKEVGFLERRPGRSHEFRFDPSHALQESSRQATLKRKRLALNSQCGPLAQNLSNSCGTDEKDADIAATALSRVISKEHFRKMEILGQFNLGFIIVKLNSDLFILDQHACDEKYNFETLQKTTTIHEQRLISPLPIEVTASEEMIIIENLDIFKKNGFHFQVDEEAPTTAKLKITALPFSKATQFGINDVHELASLLSENPGVLVRLPKATAMFASRACRSSVMIGDALDVSQMKKLVLKLEEIDQPWNCPHGRPTMRHLTDLDFLSSKKGFKVGK